MVADALGSYRLFAVASTRPDACSLNEIENTHKVGCAGFIRACVTNDDGTSNLMLQGAQRIRFTDWEEDAEYPTASVEWIQCDEACIDAETDLTNHLLDAVDDMICDNDDAAIAMLKHLRSVNDGGTVADLVAYHFLGSNQQFLQEVLNETHCVDRLAMVYDTLTSTHSDSQ